jgi:hypothetical protein
MTTTYGFFLASELKTFLDPNGNALLRAGVAEWLSR